MDFSIFNSRPKKGLWIYLLIYNFLFNNLSISAQNSGCTDLLANNFDALAITNDGSCTYNQASASASTTTNLSSPVLDENSGIIIWDNAVWTHVDSGGSNEIYKLSLSDFSILATVSLPGTTNNDWEDIAQDNDYIYIGDFGNNNNGNRTDLKIYRILKSSISGTPPFSPVIDEINFSYTDQVDFTPQGGNNTDFDCEAMIVTQNNIYLFTKEWISEETTLYSLPKTPATSANPHAANNEGSYDVNGLITGATYVEDKNLVVLSGYPNPDVSFGPFIVLLYEFNSNDFFSGNIRKISTNLFRPQIEGVASSDGINIFVSNEQSGGFVQPGIQQISLLDFLGYETSGNSVDYNNSAAWEAGVVPPSDKYAIISHDLNINQNTSIENLKINENTILTTQPDFTLSVDNQLAIVPNATLRLKDNSVLGVNGDISNNGLIYFESNSNGTAQLDKFNGSISGSGEVTVERYIPADGNRAFRFLSSPVTSSGTIFENWQNNGVNTAGVGTHITGITGTFGTVNANGLDETPSGNPSMFTFDNSWTGVQGGDPSSGAWDIVSSTNNSGDNLNAGIPYLLFVRGDRGVDLSSTADPLPSSNTTLSSTGALFTANSTQTLSSQSEYFSLVANPYQSIVQFDQLTFNGIVNSNFMYVYNPAIRNFVTLDANVPAEASNMFINPGQSFFVVNQQSANPVASSVEFQQTAINTSGTTTTVFNDDSLTILELELYNGNQSLVDEIKFRFLDNASNGIDVFDAPKLTHSTEILASNNTGKLYAIERRATIQSNDIIPLFLDQHQYNSYEFRLQTESWDADVDIYIVDDYLDTQTLISTNQPYVFTVDENIPESISTDRFSLVFDNQNFNTDDEIFQRLVSVSPNPISNSNLQLNLPQNLNGKNAEIKIFDVTGQKVFDKKYSALFNGEYIDFSTYAKGIYILNIEIENHSQQLKVIKN